MDTNQLRALVAEGEHHIEWPCLDSPRARELIGKLCTVTKEQTAELARMREAVKAFDVGGLIEDLDAVMRRHGGVSPMESGATFEGMRYVIRSYLDRIVLAEAATKE